MQLYSTNNKSYKVDLKEAVMNSLPPDNGLYMPVAIPKLSDDFVKNIAGYSFEDLSFIVAQTIIGDYIPQSKLEEIVHGAINFPAPVVELNPDLGVLELYHGPSLAFKDFGARFMARTMGYFNEQGSKELVILVATSGDTGGAVAAGFYNTPGIKVVILYPSGKVSPLQEKQLTTLGGNIEAIEVKGTFDDCQALVKKAFIDKNINERIRLSSANSINISRLIPQSFYYFEAWKQFKKGTDELSFIVPSGNYGNLTAGLFAKQMGLPIKHLVAATNSNDVVPSYLKTGDYQPKPSVQTISNAMDVGAPSNFSRMMDLYSSTWNQVKEDIKGFSYSDEETRLAMKEVLSKYNYVMDPHGAVGYLAAVNYQKSFTNTKGIILETAHPSKFLSEVESTLDIKIEVPTRLAELSEKEKVAELMDVDFNAFKSYLLKHHS